MPVAAAAEVYSAAVVTVVQEDQTISWAAAAAALVCSVEEALAVLEMLELMEEMELTLAAEVLEVPVELRRDATEEKVEILGEYIALQPIQVD